MLYYAAAADDTETDERFAEFDALSATAAKLDALTERAPDYYAYET